MLFWVDIEFLIDAGEGELHEDACVVSEEDIVLFEAFLLLHELVAEIGELELLQLNRQVVFYAEIDLQIGDPVHEVELVLIGEEDENFVERVVMEVGDQSLLMLLGVPREAELVAVINAMLIVLELIYHLVIGEQRDCFGALAKISLRDGRESL